jgi:hypothetical protein
MWLNAVTRSALGAGADKKWADLAGRSGCGRGWRGRNREIRPVGAEPTAEAAGVGAGAEVVVAGFGVAFFAFEFVVLRASVGVGVLAASGIEVRVVADDAVVLRVDTGSAEHVQDVVDGIAASGKYGNAPAAGKNIILCGDVTETISFGEDFAACDVAVKHAVGFVDAATVLIWLSAS